jgi:Lrp/AsnC family transcriptional regulator, leucine-responsive regulatory protein
MDMDDKDQLLIALLKRDARKPIVALARELGLSRSATQERLAKLLAKGHIRGFTVIEDSNTAMRQTAHLLVKLQPNKKCADVLPRLKKIPLIVAIHSVAGDLDLVLRIEAPTIAEVEHVRSSVAAVLGIHEVKTLISLEQHL